MDILHVYRQSYGTRLAMTAAPAPSKSLTQSMPTVHIHTKIIHVSPLRSRSKPVILITQPGDLRLMKNVTGGLPSVFLFPEWLLQHFKMHPSFPLSFPFSLSHGGQTISRGNIRCAGEFFSSATDPLYFGVDSYFKDERGGRRKKYPFFKKHIARYVSSIIPSFSLALSFFPSLLSLASQKHLSETDPMTCHYTPLAFFSHEYTH